MHCRHLEIRGQEKERENERDIEVHIGERLTGVQNFKILD